MQTTFEKPTRLFNRNFFMQWQGQAVSRLGEQGFLVALLFWIKHTTDSATLMGLVLMFSSLPGVLLSPLGGSVADRFSRRNIIFITDLLRGIAILSLAALIFLAPGSTNLILVCLFIVSVFTGVVNSFFNPAISASIPDLVPEDRVASANSLSQLSVQLAVFIGQGLGGTFFRILGAPVLFLINGFTYLFAAVSELFVVIPQVIPETRGDWKANFVEFHRDIVEGMRYVWNRTGLRETVFVSAFLGFFTAPIILLLPYYVEDVLKVKTDWYGFLLASEVVGMLIGYLFAGAVNFSPRTRCAVMIAFIILESFGYGLLGLVTNPFLALALALGGGITGGFVTVNITTIVQVTTPSEIRGRVFGLLVAISASLAPIANGLSGVVADLLGQNIPLLYAGCSAIMVILSIAVALNPGFRSFLSYDHRESARETVAGQVVPLN